MKILYIALYDLIKLTRERMSLLMTFLLPVVLIAIMGSINFGGGSQAIPVGIANLDPGSASQLLIDEVKKDKSISVNLYDEKLLADAVKNVDVDAGFIIPEDFTSLINTGGMPEITVLKLPSSADYMAIEGIIRGAYSRQGLKTGLSLYFDEKMNKLGSDIKASLVSDVNEKLDEELQKPALVSVETKTYSAKGMARDIDSRTQYTLGFAIMFVMWAVVFSAGEILQEKKTNTWGRLNIAPIGKAGVILGKILGSFLRGWIQVLFLILFSRYVLGIGWGESIPATIIVISVYLLSVISFGMLLASIVKTNAQLGAIASIIITCTSMLAGCYWPLEIVPDYMQKLARVFPQYWAMQGLTGTAGNQGLDVIVTPVLVLTGMGLAFFLLNMARGLTKVNTPRPAAAAK